MNILTHIVIKSDMNLQLMASATLKQYLYITLTWHVSRVKSYISM